MSAEHERLREAREEGAPWRKWGPYLSERRWGAGRADDDTNGEEGAVTHELAPYCAYESGEEGIAGICDERMHLCFAIALWNGCDPILKERLFGTPGADNTHVEDVKECYFYLDNVPTHSYMRMLYKYPQRAFPYGDLNRCARDRNRRQSGRGLADTGVFAESRYFDVLVEYAKALPEDILIRISIENRGPEAACLHVLPHLWFRNTWRRTSPRTRPLIQRGGKNGELDILTARHPELGAYSLQCEGAERLLFTDNETNTQRLYNRPNTLPYVKDGVADYLLNSNERSVNPRGQGTRAAAHYRLLIPAGGSQRLRMRLSAETHANGGALAQFDTTFALRRRETDDFYAALKPAGVDANLAGIQRQAFSGLLWSKQACPYEIRAYLHDRRAGVHTERSTRNSICRRITGSDIISTPDKWVYPWFNAPDLIFHTLALTFVDPDFAADQLELLLRERDAHPDAQIPAYEWRSNDVDPPVLAWASLLMYRLLRPRNAERAAEMLRLAFNKLMLRSPWWGGDSGECGLFEAGRRALYTQSMLGMALELALLDAGYEKLASKFLDEFLTIAAAVECAGEQGDEPTHEEGEFHALQSSGESGAHLAAEALTSFIPLCVVTVFSEAVLNRLPRFGECVRRHVRQRPDLFRNLKSAQCGHRVLSILDNRKLRRVLTKLLDNGHGVGARHHMGWTGLVAPLTGLCCDRAADEVMQELGIAFQRLAPRGDRRVDPDHGFITDGDERADPMPVEPPAAEAEKSFRRTSPQRL